MKRIIYFNLLVTLIITMSLGPIGINESLAAKSAPTNVRLEIQGLDDQKQEEGFLSKLGSWLGIRRPSTIKPEIGTKFTVQASAYAPSPYQTDSSPCITAAGTRVRYGVVATNFLPMGTLLDINGELFIVEDRMNSRYKGYYLDVWFPSTSRALEFGRRNLKITVIGYGEPGQSLKPTPAPTPELSQAEADNSQETDIRDEKEKEGVEVVIKEEETSWDFLRSWTSIMSFTLSQLLSTKVNQNVNRHDVDCLNQ